MKYFCSILFLTWFAIAIQAQTVTITANYSGGTTSTLKTIGDMDSVGDGSKRAFVKFDLSTLPANAVVTAATLQYYYYTGGGSTLNNSIFALSNDPATTTAATLYADCGDNSPVTAKLAYLAWNSTVASYYNTPLNTTGVMLINSRVGTWVGMGLTRDVGGTNLYSFRGYTNATNPPKLQLTYYIPVACNAAPTPGITATNNAFPCAGEVVNLNLTGTSVASGLGYQWQSKPIAAGAWANITGANAAAYSFAASGSLNYRCIVSCTSLALDSASNAISITALGVSAFPYSENFETSDGGWKGVDLGSGISEWIWGAPTKMNINAAANGLNCWSTNLINDYSDLSNNALESPCLNFTNVPLPRIAFSMRYRTELDYDGLYLDVSSNGGATWTKLPQSSILANTYNNTSTFASFTPPAWCGDNGGWLRYVATLPTLGGASSAKIRVHFQSDILVTDEGIAFDSVFISNTAYDLSVTSLITPVNSCSFSASNPVKISLTNQGLTLASGTKIPVTYQLNNNTAVKDTITLTVNKIIGDTIQYTFKTAAPMAAFGTYSFKIWSSLAIDSDRTNDTLVKIISILSITNLPYRENFENSDGAWTSKSVTGTLNDFYWGTPTKTFISGAASGSKCWVTKFISDYEPLSDYALESPCLNLTSGIAPSLEFSLKFKTELDYDGCILESSINGGTTWTKVTNMTTGGYNSTSTLAVFTAPLWSGSSAGWQRVKVPLASYLGQSNVKFRLHFGCDDIVNDEGVAIDSISITDLFGKDVGVTAVLSPAGGCGLTSTTPLRVKIKNFGKQLPIGTSIPISFKMLDANNVIVSAGKDTITLTAIMKYSDSLNCTFINTLNLATAGVYLISVTTALPNDSDATNDAINNYQVVSRISISTFPYYENFEINDGNWYGEGVNGGLVNEWGWNFPSKTIINSTPNGQQCWLVNPYNNYANNTHDALYSPCFDFSSMVNPVMSFLMRFRMVTNTDAMVLERSINSGLSWQRVDSANVQATYNNTNVTGGIQPPKWSGDNLAWKTYKINIPNLASQSNVQFRFRFRSDATLNDEGAAIDSVVIYDNVFNDVSVIGISAPVSKCGLSAAEVVSVTIQNLGNIPLPLNTVIPIAYSVNGNAPVQESITLTAPLPVGANLNYKFTQTANLSAPGNYSFKIYTAFPTDIKLSNDTLSNYSIGTKPIVGTFPFIDGFETGSANWSITGNNNQIWQVAGTLVNPMLTSRTGTSMSVFNATSFFNNASSRMVSPCFDFSSLNAHATLTFYLTLSSLNIAKKDSLYVLVSTNDGASWAKIASISRHNVNALTAQWSRYDIDISGYASQPQVLIAFEALGKQGANFAIDDISIYNSELRVATGTYSTGAPCQIIGGNEWIDLRDDKNNLIAQLNPYNNGLGQVCFGVNVFTNSLRSERTGVSPNKTDNYYFARNLWIQSSYAPSAPVGIRFFYQPSDFNLTKDSILARIGTSITKADLAVLNYYNSTTPDDLDVLNNNYSTGTTAFISPADSLVNNLNYFTFNTARLGEMNVVYRKLLAGITVHDESLLFELSPNPAGHDLAIKAVGLIAESPPYFIYNAIGEEVMYGVITASETHIDISSLSQGVYLIKLAQGVKKFVKE